MMLRQAVLLVMTEVSRLKFIDFLVIIICLYGNVS